MNLPVTLVVVTQCNCSSLVWLSHSSSNAPAHGSKRQVQQQEREMTFLFLRPVLVLPLILISCWPTHGIMTSFLEHPMQMELRLRRIAKHYSKTATGGGHLDSIPLVLNILADGDGKPGNFFKTCPKDGLMIMAGETLESSYWGDVFAVAIQNCNARVLSRKLSRQMQPEGISRDNYVVQLCRPVLGPLNVVAWPHESCCADWL